MNKSTPNDLLVRIVFEDAKVIKELFDMVSKFTSQVFMNIIDSDEQPKLAKSLKKNNFEIDFKKYADLPGIYIKFITKEKDCCSFIHISKNKIDKFYMSNPNMTKGVRKMKIGLDVKKIIQCFSDVSNSAKMTFSIYETTINELHVAAEWNIPVCDGKVSKQLFNIVFRSIQIYEDEPPEKKLNCDHAIIVKTRELFEKTRIGSTFSKIFELSFVYGFDKELVFCTNGGGVKFERNVDMIKCFTRQFNDGDEEEELLDDVDGKTKIRSFYESKHIISLTKYDYFSENIIMHLRNNANDEPTVIFFTIDICNMGTAHFILCGLEPDSKQNDIDDQDDD